jgi:hypothetical protein
MSLVWGAKWVMKLKMCPLIYFLTEWVNISRQNAFRLNILGTNQLDALFHVVVYFVSLHVSSVTAPIIRRSNFINTSSGMISLCDCWVCRSVGNCSFLLTDILSSHLHRLIVTDNVLIQFDLLMMGAVTVETCRDMK